jgi:hypothetical protein
MLSIKNERGIFDLEVFQKYNIHKRLCLPCLSPLSTIFQLYRGDQIYPEKITDRRFNYIFTPDLCSGNNI